MAFDANKVLGISSILAPVVSGIAGGVAGGKDRKQTEQTLAYQRQQDEIRRQEEALKRYLEAQQNAYGTESSARGGQISNLQALGNGDLERSLGILNATKLGDEQALAGRNAVRLALGQSMGNRELPTAYGGVNNPFKGMDLTSFTPDATRAAIEERRKMLAGVQPDFQFGSLNPYGMEDTNNVATYQDIASGKRSANENAVTQLVNDQLEMARTAGQNQVSQVGQFNTAQDAEALARTQAAIAPPEQEKKSGGFMGFLKGLGKGALKLAPFAAMAIPGIGPVAGGLLRAGLGAAGGALDGGGWKGALTGGALGALPTGGQAPGGTGIISNLKQSILSPMGIGKVAGAFTPGAAGQAIGAAANMLPGPNFQPKANPYEEAPRAPWLNYVAPGQMNRVEGFADRTNPVANNEAFVNQNNQFLTPQPSQGRMTNVLRPPARTGTVTPRPQYAPGTMVPLSASPYASQRTVPIPPMASHTQIPQTRDENAVQEILKSLLNGPQSAATIRAILGGR